MSKSRMRMGHEKDEPTPPNTFQDFDWIQAHWDELVDQYGEGFILVFEQQVLGFGDSYLQAVADAERNLPDSAQDITPVVESIYRRQPFTRLQFRSIRPSSQDK